MKFLLAAVNTKYIHSNPAVYSLKAYAEKKDPALSGCVEIAEYTINHQISDVLADLYVRKPDILGFSCYIWNIDYVLELAQEMKKLLPKLVIWLGGPEVSFDADVLLKTHPFITGVICGEGEETFYQLVKAYKQAQDEGLDFEEVCTGKLQNAEVVLSEVPFLYEDSAPFENRILYYESSRGCPFRCSYCLSSIDKTVRLRDIEIVKKELSFFIEKKVRQVKFVDRTFNCNKAHALAIWEYLLAHDNGVTNFHFEIAADLLGEEELLLLSKFRPGALQLEIGVQSTNTQTIAEIDRRMDVERLRRIVKRIHDGGNIHIHLDLIAGLPYEDYESFGKSFNDVYAMQPEQLQLGFLKVLKGSKMYRKAEDYGLVYRSKPPYEVLYTDWLSFEDVCRLKKIEEMVELYYNSNQFTVTLPAAIRRYPSAFAFFEALADYYEQQGYFIQSPARSYRYQVLLEFLKQSLSLDKEREAFFAECLTIDLYLRENCKTRPDFAPDVSEEKESMRAFFRKEAEDYEVLGEAYADYDARMLARSLHMEPVKFDHETEEYLKEPEYWLFDYKDRNALTYEAKTYKIGRKTDE